jgi:uncharacterized Zn-binding protein involved in type VI secretion
MATDTHFVILPNGAVAPLPHPFVGIIDDVLSPNVNIMGMPAATVDSTAVNRITPNGHLPTPPGTRFQRAPTNKGTITKGSGTVYINKKAAARHGDAAETCNDPADAPIGTVTVDPACKVMIG